MALSVQEYFRVSTLPIGTRIGHPWGFYKHMHETDLDETARKIDREVESGKIPYRAPELGDFHAPILQDAKKLIDVLSGGWEKYGFSPNERRRIEDLFICYRHLCWDERLTP